MTWSNHALQRTRRERRGCNRRVPCAGSLSWVVCAGHARQPGGESPPSR